MLDILPFPIEILGFVFAKMRIVVPRHQKPSLIVVLKKRNTALCHTEVIVENMMHFVAGVGTEEHQHGKHSQYHCMGNNQDMLVRIGLQKMQKFLHARAEIIKILLIREVPQGIVCMLAKGFFDAQSLRIIESLPDNLGWPLELVEKRLCAKLCFHNGIDNLRSLMRARKF